MCWLRLTGIIGIFLTTHAMAQIYPSTATGWVLPGGWEEPLATSNFDSALDVEEWEMRHADVVFGSLQNAELNQQTIAMGYMYAHKLDCKPGEQTAWLSKQAHQQEIDIEDIYLHFTEDTRLSVPSVSRAMDYLLQGQPLHLLLIRDGNFSTVRLPLSLMPSDELLLLSSYPFTQLNVTSDIAPKVARSLASEQGDIAQWQPTDSEWLKIKDQWQGDLDIKFPWVSAFPAYQQHELAPGNKALASGLKIWALKLSWPIAGKLTAVNLKSWLAFRNEELIIPGWDVRNDKNGDGYISDLEYRSRTSTTASARFRHQSRLIPAGKMRAGSCWYRTNFSDQTVNELHARWYYYDWQRQGLSGAYNDDMAKLLGENQFKVLSGGGIAEILQTAGTAGAESVYAGQMAQFLRQVKNSTQTDWLAANISDLNLWEYPAWPQQLREAVDVWLREHYLSPAMGLKKMQRSWDSFALAHLGDKSLIMSTTRGGRSELQPASMTAWHKDIETGLALYYFFNIPGMTYYHSWNQTFVYGSGNTTTANWYRQGVPKNWVYQPTKMLEVDIGRPVKAPKGYKAVYWQSLDNIAKSTATELSAIELRAANWFWLYRSGWLGNFPSEGVMARQYSGGLVIYRAVKRPDEKDYFQAKSMRISLPGVYQRVNIDGTLSAPIRYIEIGGYEGAVLKKVR
ncbi:hypothetical protein [Photobacterium lipolyticum]|uniref:Uncharacterized protein n=1 Tax=Photobacterium lipolyticum TaxID=266810 RepID=A0A2T3MTA4_9GAMM|nr:hypothetical protein [Photobacterium lipolyticum]PSW02093.1 hypothetical protein C9I89_19155 [Photobacterium lipolyticum]